MSLKLGGSKKKFSNTSSGTSTSRTIPTLPGWATSLTQGAAGQVGQVMGTDPGSLVAPAHPLQTLAANRAAGLTGLPWNFDRAAALTRGVADTSWLTPHMSAATPQAAAGQASDYLSRYQNPYLRDVVDSSAADFDAHAGQVRAQQSLDLAGSGAFGGSGAALTQSMTEGELARGRTSTLAGLRSQAFNTALGAAAGDADRATQTGIANAQTALQDRAQRVSFGFQGQQQQLHAADQLANLSATFDANQRNNIATQAAVGDSFRTIDQQQRQAPVTQAQQVVAMLSGLPISLFRGEESTGTKTETGSGTEKNKDWGFSFSPEEILKTTIAAGK
jgi:hypothetical protein